MNTKKIHIGDEIKNYYALCAILEVPEKSGKSKKYQLEDFKRYFKWEKCGHKFKITDVYEIPIPKNKKQNNLGHYRRKDNYDYGVDYINNTKIGVYKIQLGNKVYIGSTIRGFRERFNKHVRDGSNMPHTRRLLDDGGRFEILWIANNGESENAIRRMEQHYINEYYKNGYDIVNESLQVKIKGEPKPCKQKRRLYKNIKISKEDFNMVVLLLQSNGIEIYS